MTKTILPRSSVKVGQTIWAELPLQVEDIVPTLLASSTSNRIRKGQAVRRMAVVLRVDNDKLKVVYLATFGTASTLALTGLDEAGIKNWYAIKPALKEGTLDPLNTKVPQSVACWASLRTAFDVTAKNVQVLQGPVFDEDAVAAIMQNVEAGW